MRVTTKGKWKRRVGLKLFAIAIVAAGALAIPTHSAMHSTTTDYIVGARTQSCSVTGGCSSIVYGLEDAYQITNPYLAGSVSEGDECTFRVVGAHIPYWLPKWAHKKAHTHRGRYLSIFGSPRAVKATCRPAPEYIGG